MAPWVSGTPYDRITEVVFNRYSKVSLLPRTFKYFDSLIRHVHGAWQAGKS